MASIDLNLWPTLSKTPLSQCEGSTVLVQRYLLELLTEKDTIVYNPDRGTDFLTELRSGSITNETVLHGAFTLAESDVRTILNEEEDDTMPDNERYVSSTLKEISLNSGFVVLAISIVTKAGPININVPVNIG